MGGSAGRRLGIGLGVASAPICALAFFACGRALGAALRANVLDLALRGRFLARLLRVAFFAMISGILTAMTADNDDELEPTIFSAVITPHRSLSATGFFLLMAAFGLLSFVAGLACMLAGAWPVFGFFGLDVLLLYWAFKVNYRRAAAYEEVKVTPVGAHRAQGQPSRHRARMGAQPALGAARQDRARGIRHRAPVPGLARQATDRRRLPRARTKRRASPRRSATRSTRPSAG